MDSKIFLQKFNSKLSSNTSEGLNISLRGKRKLLPTNEVADVISQYNVYSEEREKCNKIRLTCQVNTICTNVLYNSVTEIVRNEGDSEGMSFVNYNVVNGDYNADASVLNGIDNGTLYFKEDTVKFWSSENVYQAIRDTQLTNPKNGYIYHCGIDMFNNHLVRSNTFKPVTEVSNNKTDINVKFNTIEDTLRSVDGTQITERIFYPSDSGLQSRGENRTGLHLYTYEDIYTYEECIANRLVKAFDGWLGFYNKAKMKSYLRFAQSSEETMGIDKPLVYLNGSDFIDLYPDRSLFSFVPKYNKFKNREENNWNYCITYPSSSYTPSLDDENPLEFTDIIEPSNGALKAVYFNENTLGDDGGSQLVIYSVAKHGLSVNDNVNIYTTVDITDDSGNTTPNTELVITNAKVTNIVNDFIFTVLSTVKLGNNWTELTDEEYNASELTLSINVDPSNPSVKEDFTFYEHKYFAKGINNDEKYYLIEGTKYVNFDRSTNKISYKRVVNDIECEYYIRIFSRLPNFKHASGDTSSENEIYRIREDGKNMIDIYQDPKYKFESHISRLAFAKNSYSDNLGEVVFTDDIDISNLKDNLGRPLTSIYLTIIKNNAGYKEWYGFDVHNGENWNEEEILSERVEFSHCFGRVTCGIETSIESKYDNDVKSINKITSIGNDGMSEPPGYNVDLINGDRDDYDVDAEDKRYDINPTEVWFSLDKHFYGDLCYYDNFNAVERVIQPILHRFNTAQRESQTSESAKYFSSYRYDEITGDDYDYNGFSTKTFIKKNVNAKKEGYYYNPHYEIRIKTFDKLNMMMPDFLTITKIEAFTDRVKFTSLENHYLSVGDKSMVYDKVNNAYYHCVTVKGFGDNYKVYTCKLYDENGNAVSPFTVFSGRPKSEFKVFKMDNFEMPSYAKILRDGTCRIIWRNVVNNGFNLSDKTLEEYPFTNGTFYVNRPINLYLKRQDPYNYWGLYSVEDIPGSDVETEEDDYVKEKEIQGC